ncbi:MAG: signal peptidase I [Defluviitaleaceae bacterium]|nr:signal peptidase I [Defluviitaleaceae bacterium]
MDKSVLWVEAFGWIKLILFALIVAWVLTNFVIVNASVPTGSMENTIRINDRIIAFRLSYTFSDPGRFDIIVFRGPDGESPLYVKRIIGIPGDTVTIVDGHVFINGEDEPLRYDFVQGEFFGNFPIPRNPLPDHITIPADGSPPYLTVPEGSFFVLGDNRGNSIDSRNWEVPFVTTEQILGQVIFRYFPGFQNLTRP